MKYIPKWAWQNFTLEKSWGQLSEYLRHFCIFLLSFISFDTHTRLLWSDNTATSKHWGHHSAFTLCQKIMSSFYIHTGLLKGTELEKVSPSPVLVIDICVPSLRVATDVVTAEDFSDFLESSASFSPSSDLVKALGCRLMLSPSWSFWSLANESHRNNVNIFLGVWGEMHCTYLCFQFPPPFCRCHTCPSHSHSLLFPETSHVLQWGRDRTPCANPSMWSTYNHANFSGLNVLVFWGLVEGVHAPFHVTVISNTALDQLRNK